MDDGSLSFSLIEWRNVRRGRGCLWCKEATDTSGGVEARSRKVMRLARFARQERWMVQFAPATCDTAPRSRFGGVKRILIMPHRASLSDGGIERSIDRALDHRRCRLSSSFYRWLSSRCRLPTVTVWSLLSQTRNALLPPETKRNLPGKSIIDWSKNLLLQRERKFYRVPIYTLWDVWFYSVLFCFNSSFNPFQRD